MSSYKKIFQKHNSISTYAAIVVSFIIHLGIAILVSWKFSNLDVLSVTVLHNHLKEENVKSTEINFKIKDSTDNKESFKKQTSKQNERYLSPSLLSPKSNTSLNLNNENTNQFNKNKLYNSADSKNVIKNSKFENDIHKDLKKDLVEYTNWSDLKQNNSDNPKNIYLTKIRSKIAQSQTYPEPSIIFKEEGTVEIKIRLNKDGSVLKIELFGPSKYNRLNHAAITAVTKASPFPTFPKEVNFDSWIITLPIKFKIEDQRR